MKNILILIQFTLREAMARKVFIFFAAITVFILVCTLLVIGLIDINTLNQIVDKSAKELIVNELVSKLELSIVIILAPLGLILAIFSSSSFIPELLEKGNVDLFLSKPVSRIQLLIGKYLGVILFVFVNIFIFVLGVWLIISLKFNYWDFSFLTLSLVIVYVFAVLYSLIVLFGVITRTSIPGMMIAYVIFIILSPFKGNILNTFDKLTSSEVIKTILHGLYYVVPQTAELMGKTMVDLAFGRGIADLQPVFTSFLFLILMLAFSFFLFRKKDF